MLINVTSAFKGFTQPLQELVDDIHRRGWTVAKIHVKDGKYVAEGKNPHGEKLEATGNTDSTAAANLLVKIMRREHMRSSSIKERLGAWDAYPLEQQMSAIAQAYAGAPVYDPKAAPAWMELAQDCQRRAQIIKAQITIEYTYDPIPYESANDLRDDVTKKRHITLTRAYSHHPVWSESQILDYRLVVDVLGHTLGGADWGWHGTCLAFAQLAPLLADLPQKALFTELLGQSAFGQFYRQWGPQKIVFLQELVEKAQEKENKPGHHGVHPSQSIVPLQVPHVGAVVGAPKDPNADWESGITPLPDNGYLWQRQDGVDPLNINDVTESLYPLEAGISNMHPHLVQQAVVNALRSSLLGSRQSPRNHAIHYQTLMSLPATIDDPAAFHDALEQARENWNTAQGYAPGSHKQHWPEEQMFKQWVKSTNPHLDDGEINRLAKRELLHMLMEEEERVISQDEGEQLPAEQIEHEAYEALRTRLKAVTKPSLDQKVDFGDTHLWHESTYHADMFPPYLATRLRPLAQVGKNAAALAEAAREDLLSHRGHGHHFRSTALSLGIPGLGPRQVSTAWLHLAPQTSQLGIVNPETAEMLGHSREDITNRDYFKHERELHAGRDAAGYGHVPLGAFSAGMWDLYAGGPGWHPDRTPYKVYSPTPHHTIDWNQQIPQVMGWDNPYWWQSTSQARDQVGQDFDRSVGAQTPKEEIPFKTAMAERSGFPELDAAIAEFMQTEHNELGNIQDFSDPQVAWGRCQEVAEHCADFLNSRGFKAYAPGDEIRAFPGYEGYQNSEAIGAGDFTYPEHAMVEVYGLYGPNNVNTVTIDFTASQYGFTEFPKIEPGPPGPLIGPQQQITSSSIQSPWVTHPETGQRLTGPPGTSLMQHLKGVFGHQGCQEVWAAPEYEVGKGSPPTPKTAMALRPDQIEQYIAENGPYLYHGMPHIPEHEDEKQGLLEYPTLQDRMDSVKTHGIHPDWGAGSYYHIPSVYLAREPQSAYSYANRGYGKGGAVYRVDLRKLDPSKIEADEWQTPGSNLPLGVEEYWGDDTWGREPAHAQYVADPDNTLKSLQGEWNTVAPGAGAVGYRGAIPPEALELHDSWEE